MKQIIRAYRYRLLPTKKQHKDLLVILESQRQLYNAALEERIGCYRKTGKGRSYVDQTLALTELRKDAEFTNVSVALQRWTLRRIDNAYKAFFKFGGFPRFRSYARWRSFGYSQFLGITLKDCRLHLKGVHGGLRVHFHRPLKGKIVSCIFTKDVKGWYVSFQTKVELQTVAHTGAEVGLDVGLKTFASLSNGGAIPAPQIARRAHKQLRQKQRALARCKCGSNRRKKIKSRLESAFAKIANTRKTFLHQHSARLVKEYGLIAVEDLKIRNMVKNHNLARSISDAGWGIFINMIEYKAEEAGTRFVKVNPRNTSQACSGCGQIVQKDLSVRVHSCDCGLVLDRDVNAARNILTLAVVGQKQDNVTECRKRPARNIRSAA